LQREFIFVSRYVKIIKLHQDFPELWSQIYCHVFLWMTVYKDAHVCGVQLIDMLDRRVGMQHDVLVQCAVTAARTNEMQLESDVLRHKLTQLTYVNSTRSVQWRPCHHLSVDNETIRSTVQWVLMAGIALLRQEIGWEERLWCVDWDIKPSSFLLMPGMTCNRTKLFYQSPSGQSTFTWKMIGQLVYVVGGWVQLEETRIG